jgi:hypothetical protein
MLEGMSLRLPKILYKKEIIDEAISAFLSKGDLK